MNKQEAQAKIQRLVWRGKTLGQVHAVLAKATKAANREQTPEAQEVVQRGMRLMRMIQAILEDCCEQAALYQSFLLDVDEKTLTDRLR